MLALVRGLHLAALLSLFGTAGFIAWTLPAADHARAMVKPMQRLWRLSGMAALLSGLLWFGLQAATIAGAGSVRQIAAALPMVLEHTRYGNLLLLRLVLILIATLLADKSRVRLYVALPVIATSVALQGLIGHAGAMSGSEGTELVVSEVSHLLAAGLWLGALIPLLLCLGRLTPQDAASICIRFSPIGLGCVLMIAGTGLMQSIALVGGVPALLGTRYGGIVLLKIGLFVVALALATINRLRLTDRLLDAHASARARLRLSVVCETLIGLAIIIAAGYLASTMPGTHETPVWLLSWRIDLAVLSDPQGRDQLLNLLLPSGLALMAMLASWRRRVTFWVALVVLVLTLAMAGPRLVALLTVDAYPTTFARSPTEFADSSIARGARLFAIHCASCHGSAAKGDGPAARSLPVPPADLTAAHFRAHTEGDLFWHISHGITGPANQVAMPAFAPVLSSDQRWAVIDFLRANNAAYSLSADGQWTAPVPLPQLDAICANGSLITQDDLRGRIVHILTDPKDTSSLGHGDQAILLSLTPGAKPVGGACVSVEPAAWKALAVLAGLAPDALAGTQMLVDPDGWMRRLWRPGDLSNWDDPKVLAELEDDIAAHKLAGAMNTGHAHHQ